MIRKDMRPRLNKLLNILEQENLDAAIVTGIYNIQYYTGVKIVTEDTLMALYVNKEGETKLYVPLLEYYRVLKEVGNNIEVYSFSKTILKDVKYAGKGLKDTIIDLIKSHKKIGLDYKFTPTTIITSIANINKDRVVDISSHISKHRMIKEVDEVKSIKKAIEVTIKGIVTAIDNLYTGVEESFLAGIFENRVRVEGVEEYAFPPLILFKPNNSYPHNLPSKTRLKTRDLVLIDVGVKVNGYCSDLTRTIPWGRLSYDERKAIEAVNEAIEEVIDYGEPGIKAKELALKAINVLKKYGLDKYFIHGLGHGIGLKVHEEPYINTRSETILEPGMVFTVEPGVYIPGKYGVRIEEDIIVTNRGLKVLSKRLKRILTPLGS